MARSRFLFDQADNLLLPLGPDFSVSHPLTGTVNGINTVFTLAAIPKFGLLITVGGLVQQPGAGNDYTISGTTVTFGAAPVLRPIAYF